MQPITTIRKSIEELAQGARGLRFNFTPRQVEELAELALLIAQNELRSKPPPGLVLTDLVPYAQRQSNEKEALRSHVIRVVKALVLLGWIDLPS